MSETKSYISSIEELIANNACLRRGKLQLSNRRTLKLHIYKEEILVLLHDFIINKLEIQKLVEVVEEDSDPDGDEPESCISVYGITDGTTYSTFREQYDWGEIEAGATEYKFRIYIGQFDNMPFEIEIQVKNRKINRISNDVEKVSRYLGIPDGYKLIIQPTRIILTLNQADPALFKCNEVNWHLHRRVLTIRNTLEHVCKIVHKINQFKTRIPEIKK